METVPTWLKLKHSAIHFQAFNHFQLNYIIDFHHFDVSIVNGNHNQCSLPLAFWTYLLRLHCQEHYSSLIIFFFDNFIFFHNFHNFQSFFYIGLYQCFKNESTKYKRNFVRFNIWNKLFALLWIYFFLLFCLAIFICFFFAFYFYYARSFNCFFIQNVFLSNMHGMGGVDNIYTFN